VVDLRGTTKNAVDPTTLKNNSSQISTQAQASQTTVRALDSALGTGPASQDAQHPEANGAPTAQAETLAQSPDAAQTSKSIDQALGQNQDANSPQTSGQPAAANASNPAAAIPTSQSQTPNSKLLDSAQNPDFDGRTTGNGPIGNGGANSAPATPAASVPSAPPAVAAPAATGNNSNSAPAGPAGHPQSTLNPQTANSIANPDFDGRATGNAPLQNFSPNANSGVAVTAAPATATAQPVTGGTTNFFGTKTSIPSLLPAPTQPNPQPATPMPVATDTNAWNAACPRAAAPASGAAGPTAIDLAANPELADIDRIELQQVDAHMARLHKELDVLQKRDQDVLNEGEELHQEMVEQDHEIDWQALSFVTAGLGEVLKTASAADVQQAESIQMSNIWGELGVEKANLQNMLASSHGQEADELKAAIAAYDQVDRAHKLKNNVELGFKLQDAMIVETEELKHLSALDPKTADVLFESSVMMGRLAIVFGKGVVEKCSAVAAFGEPFTEASAIYVMMLQEEQQMKELGNGLADRQTMRRQIDEQLGELENKQQMLRVEIQRADPCARLGSN
jgi:hypothetical protein